MRTERIIAIEIETKKAAYHEAAPTMTAAEQKAASDEIKGLQQELCDLLSEGAKPCPLTGDKPIGMKVGKGVYEVGPITSNLRARGETAEEAVEKWNKGEYFIKTEADQEAVKAVTTQALN